MAALSTQLETMQCVRNENADLQDKNLALVSQLRAREEELERLLREQVGSLFGKWGRRVLCGDARVGWLQDALH